MDGLSPLSENRDLGRHWNKHFQKSPQDVRDDIKLCLCGITLLGFQSLISFSPIIEEVWLGLQ